MVVMTKQLFASYTAASWKTQVLVAGAGFTLAKYGPKKIIEVVSDATDSAIEYGKKAANAIPAALLTGTILWLVVGNLSNKRQKN